MMKWLAALFGIFILTIIVLADLGKLGFLSSVYDFPYGDKVGHFILYGTLTFLIDRALFQALPLRSRNRVAVISGLILALLIGAEEFSQKYFAEYRTFDLIDLAASYLGVAFFAWLALRINK